MRFNNTVTPENTWHDFKLGDKQSVELWTNGENIGVLIRYEKDIRGIVICLKTC